MSEIKIETDKPIPKIHGNSRYPFKIMEVGESFFVPKNQGISMQNSAAGYGYRHNMKFTVRIDGDGYRCWRVE